jgi:uncharacterized protein DUF2867
MVDGRLPNGVHAARQWRIGEIAPDFRVEDVWALPTPGGPDDFPRLVELMSRFDPEHASSRAGRALWAIRWKLGALLGWDDPDAERPTLRDRLPQDLREADLGPPPAVPGPFSHVYRLDDEWALEIANRTMHGVLHAGWVADGDGGYRGEMAVLVKPNGRLGDAYMLAIRPFRHRVVYPPVLRSIGRRWANAPRVAAAGG